MAFTVGDRARVKLSSAALAAGTLQPQPPLIGLVTKVVGTTITVTFGGAADGLAVDDDFLDDITDTASVTRDAMLDKVVTGMLGATEYASAYTGRVVDIYDVDGATKVLIKSLLNGMYYELPIADVSIMGDR